MILRRSFSAAFFLAMTCAAAANAQTAAALSYDPPAVPPGLGAGSLLLRLAAMTMIPLTGMAGIAWYLRRGQAWPLAHASEHSHIQRIGDLALNRVCSLHMLQVAGQKVVLGIDQTGLKTMQVVEEPFRLAIADES